MQNNDLASISQIAPKNVINAIHKASTASGVDFAYLVDQARAESSFNPGAKAKTSSAKGLYQFIESTWISMVEKYGEDYGIQTEGKSRAQILEMRADPEKASNMAAELARENKGILQKLWGGDIGSTELYFAHFMGPSKAAAFLKARDENPLQTAADLFPREARANRAVFYEKGTATPKTLADIYNHFDKKFKTDAKTGQAILAHYSAAEGGAAGHVATKAGQERIVRPAPVQQKPPSIVRQFHHPNLQVQHVQKTVQDNMMRQAGGLQNLLYSPLDLIMLTQMDYQGNLLR